MYDYVKPSNDARDKRALLAHLMRHIRASGSWSGETHIQKSMYFLQSLLNVDTGYHFVLYLHGPFSFDVHEVLTWMISRCEIDLQRFDLYGPRLKLTPGGKKLAGEHEGFDDQMKWVSSHIATMNVVDLERVGTVCLLKTGAPDWSDEQIANELHRLKPHITPEVGLQGIREFEELRQTAISAGVVIPADPEVPAPTSQ